MTNITKTQLDSYIATNSLIKGKTYEVSDCHTSLFGGTTIIIKAIETDKIEVVGTGIFYLPKYDKSIIGFGIFDKEKTYLIDETVIYGGYVWKNVTGISGFEIDVLTLDSNWQKVDYNDVDYTISYDTIKYDYTNDLIIYREDAQGQYCKVTKTDLDYLAEYYGFTINPIAVIQWGNDVDYLQQKGTLVYNNGGYIETVNFKGNFIYNASFDKGSSFSENSIDYGVSIQNLKTSINCSIRNNNFKENSYLNYINLFNGSNLNDTLLGENSGVNFLNIGLQSAISWTIPNDKTLQNIEVKGVTSVIDLSNSIVIYEPYFKNVFANSENEVKVTHYENNSLILNDILD